MAALLVYYAHERPGLAATAASEYATLQSVLNAPYFLFSNSLADFFQRMAENNPQSERTQWRNYLHWSAPPPPPVSLLRETTPTAPLALYVKSGPCILVATRAIFDIDAQATGACVVYKAGAIPLAQRIQQQGYATTQPRDPVLQRTADGRRYRLVLAPDEVGVVALKSLASCAASEDAWPLCCVETHYRPGDSLPTHVLGRVPLYALGGTAVPVAEEEMTMTRPLRFVGEKCEKPWVVAASGAERRTEESVRWLRLLCLPRCLERTTATLIQYARPGGKFDDDAATHSLRAAVTRFWEAATLVRQGGPRRIYLNHDTIGYKEMAPSPSSSPSALSASSDAISDATAMEFALRVSLGDAGMSFNTHGSLFGNDSPPPTAKAQAIVDQLRFEHDDGDARGYAAIWTRPDGVQLPVVFMAQKEVNHWVLVVDNSHRFMRLRRGQPTATATPCRGLPTGWVVESLHVPDATAYALHEAQVLRTPNDFWAMVRRALPVAPDACPLSRLSALY